MKKGGKLSVLQLITFLRAFWLNNEREIVENETLKCCFQAPQGRDDN